MANTTKIKVIEYILMNGPVAEPNIRKHLKETDKSVSQATVNRILHELQNEPACIELIEPIKKSRSNYWDITKTKHLKNIQLCCPDILLSTYEKSIYIILQEWGETTISLRSLKIYICLLLSPSLFDECIVSGVEVLLSRAWQMYLCNEGFKNDWGIKKLLNNFYSFYIADNPDFELLEEIFRKQMEELIPKIEDISEEKFLRMLEEKFPGLSKEMFIETFLETEEEVNKRMKDSSISSSVFKEWLDERLEEKFPGWPKQMPVDKHFDLNREIDQIAGGFSEEIHRGKIYKKVCDKKFSEWSKEKGVLTETARKNFKKDLMMYRKMIEILSLMKKQQETFKMSSSNLLTKHFYDHDILTGKATDEEIEFVKNMKANVEIFHDLSESHDFQGMLRTELLGDLKYESEIIFKYKKPSIFSDNCSKPDEVYQRLIDFFGFRSILKKPF